MNPSASGWINKFGYDVKDNLEAFTDFRDLYGGLKTSGFVYGLNIKIPRFISLSRDPITGLLYSLNLGEIVVRFTLIKALRNCNNYVSL